MIHNGWSRVLSLSFVLVFFFGICSLIFPLNSAFAQSRTPIDIPVTTEIIAKSDIFTLVYLFAGIIIFGIGTFIGTNIFRR